MKGASVTVVPKVRSHVNLGGRFLHDAHRGCTLMHLPATISETEIAHTTTLTRLAHRSPDENKFFSFQLTHSRKKEKKGGEEQEVGKQDIRSLKQQHLDPEVLSN